MIQSSWRRLGQAGLLLGLALALIVPAAATAATGASFSSRTPGSGSSTSNTRPKISCTVYDSAGIHGSGSVYMTVDGRKVLPSVSYIVSGGFDPSRPDYRKLKVSFTSGGAMAVGSHTVYLKVKDRRSRSYSTTWKFKITGPEPAYSASFSSAKPSSGSVVHTKSPAISIGVSDKYGVSGSGTYALAVDGAPVATSIRYSTSGSTTAFTLSGTASGLSYGTHAASAKVTDLHKHVSTYSWTFTVSPFRATLSAMSPAPGSLATSAAPTISVRVDDAYGVSGAGSCTLALDGTAVPSTVAYVKAGDSTAFTLSAGSVAVQDGTHTVDVSVTDMAGNVTTSTWTFVEARGLDEMPVTIQSGSCSSCHVGYPTQHPMTNCQACHGPGKPVPGTSYTPASLSAHTLSCATMVCHRGPGNAFPHVLGSDCSSCHQGQYNGVPVAHGAMTSMTHLSTNGFCTQSGCHQRSLTVEHYRYPVGGTAFTCATCHLSGDATVTAAIAAGTTDCIACHGAGFASTPHVGTTTAHANPGLSCNQPGCHTADLPGIHKGACAPCHAPGVTASSRCGSCHPVTVHASAVAQHTAPDQTCTSALCHGTNGMQIHLPRGVLACQSCHRAGVTATLVCTACHTQDFSTIHTKGSAKHAATSDCTASGCHSTGPVGGTADVTAIHSAGANPPGCAACHAPGVTPSVTCLDCHKAHATLAQHQVSNSCSSCHGADVSVIHTTGTRPPGCVACHASGKTLTTVCATAGCHAGLSTSHASHLSTTTSDVISIAGADYGRHNCNECHTSMDLQTLHGSNSCAKCHPAPANAAAKGDFSCVQGGCHTATSTKPMHAGIDAAHVPDPAAAVSCGGGGCHGTITSIAALHASGPGCAACHNNPSHALSRTCSNCHAPHDLVTPHAASPAPRATIQIGTATYALPACTTCHTLDLRDLHSGNCAACHTVSVNTTLGGQWNKGCVQGGCHTPSSANPVHANATADHQIVLPSGFTSCMSVDCHTGSDLAGLHAKFGCTTCHAVGKKATGVCSTAGCHENGAPASHKNHIAGDGAAAFTINNVTYPGTISCSFCHAGLDLQAIHGTNSCLKCHPSPASTAATGDFSCLQGNCHTRDLGNMKLEHGGIDSAHAITLPIGWTCTQGGCHVATDLAALHVGKRGCVTCHGFGKTPTGDCQASGCHDGVPVPLPPSHTQHQVTLGSTAISIKGTDYGMRACADCHSSDLQTIHAAGGCATCHSATKALPSGGFDCQQGGCHGATDVRPMHGSIDTTHAIVMPTNWSCATGDGCHSGGDLAALHAKTTQKCAACHSTVDAKATSDCRACHTSVTTDGLPLEHRVLHDVNIPSGCGGTDCHTPDANNLTDIHKTLGCSVCHAPAAGSAIPTATLKAAIDGHKTNCDACHARPHAASHQWCSDCHANFDSGPVPDGVDPSTWPTHTNAQPMPSASCASCHGAPFAPLSGIANAHTGCAFANCHKGNSLGTPSADLHYVDAAQGACFGTGCHANNLTVIHSAGCATCHAPTSTKIPAARIAAAIANNDKRCATCHGSGSLTSHTSHISTQTVGAVRINGAVYDVKCTDCHGTSGAMDLQKVHGETGANDSCAKCHSTYTDSAAPGSFSCKQGGCHTQTVGNMQLIHNNADAAHLATLPTGWTCVQAGCHNGVDGTSGKIDLAKIHAPSTKSCSACHGTGQTPQSDCTLSACHGAGFPDHKASHAVCNNCHAGDPNWSCASAGDCHGEIHWSGPTIGIGNCQQCHTGASTWTHPGEGGNCYCHGDYAIGSWPMSW